MNKFYLGAAALAAVMMTACSSDELIEKNVSDANAISFGATSELTSRAVESYCNTNLPGNFTVTAKVKGSAETYFADEVATREGNTTKYSLGTTFYWPANDLEFYAWVNDNKTYNYNGGTPKFNNFKPAATAQQQLDLLYAVKTDAVKFSEVKLNFRHALSQIVFRADNESGLTIKIKGVKVGKAYSEGSFTFPAASTDPNYENHTDKIEDVTLLNQGTWEGVQASERVDYSVEFPAVEVGKDLVNLTSVNHKQGGDLSMILLPQTAEAWDPTVKGTDANDYNGSYFALDVEMYNSESAELYKGLALVPAKLEWKQGVRYIYTFHFNAGGNGGYRPDPVDPKPVLGGITFDVTTDDFINAEGGDNNMNATEFPEADKEYTLAYNCDALGIHETFTVKGEETKAVTIPTETPAVAEGKKFLGWATAEGGEVVYNGGETVVLSAKNPELNLFPVYGDLAKVNINIPALKVNETHYLADGVENYEYTIPAETPAVEEGQEFLGWATTPDATEAGLHAGDKVNVAAGETLNLYPVFATKNVELTLTFDICEFGEGAVAPMIATVKYGEKASFVAPEGPKSIDGDTGYTFQGWSYTKPAGIFPAGEVPEGMIEVGDTIEIDANTTVYAVYMKTTQTSGGGSTTNPWS